MNDDEFDEFDDDELDDDEFDDEFDDELDDDELDERDGRHDDWFDEDGDIDRAPICGSCGVTALPAHRANVIDSPFVCDNEGCDAYGEPI